MRWKHFTLTAMIVGLSVIGSFIKIPTGIGSLALDSAPVLVSVIFLQPLFSSTAAIIGHVASALNSGFPLGPFHLLIALEMFIIVYIFAKLHQAKYNRLKWLFFIIANGILASLPFYFIISPAFFIGIVPMLLATTIINAIIAAVLMPSIKPLLAKKVEMKR